MKKTVYFLEDLLGQLSSEGNRWQLRKERIARKFIERACIDGSDSLTARAELDHMIDWKVNDFQRVNELFLTTKHWVQGLMKVASSAARWKEDLPVAKIVNILLL